MTTLLNATHDRTRRSWLTAANEAGTDFPIQNLPLGVMRREGVSRAVVAIGDAALDLVACLDAGLLQGLPDAVATACRAPNLNALMGLGGFAAAALRRAVGDLLDAARDSARPPTGALVPLARAEMVLPASIGDYTDFYASIHHATNVGRMFRPDNPLLPNYRWVPIAYHGRASSVVVSGTAVRRPHGQRKEEAAPAPVFAPTERLDYEVELGCFVGPGNTPGQSIPLGSAGDHLFGYCLLNDWSARDIQPWEYQPLGPFLSKNFATSISPWVVTSEALAPFRAPLAARAPGDPEPLAYLQDPRDRSAGGLAITLEAALLTGAMRAAGLPPFRLSASDTRDLYWTPAQMLTHHASGGCLLRPGDLFGSGTVSGPGPEARGCLLELTERGARPLTLPTGEVRRFLEDGDEVILTGRAMADGAVSIGFGACIGRVIP